MEFPTAPNEKGLGSDEAFGRVEEYLRVLKASHKDLVSRNAKLQEELQEANAREAELRARNTDLKGRVVSQEKYDHSKRNNKTIESREMLAFEEGFVEQMIRRIKDKATATNSTVPVKEYERLHRVYFTIKEENKKLEAKYTTAEQDRVYLKQSLIKCYKSSGRADQEYLEKRCKERKQRRSIGKGNASRAEVETDQKARLAKDDGTSFPNPLETQQTEPLPDRALSSDISLAIEERKSAKGGDVVNNSESEAEEEKDKETSSVSKIANSDCVDSRGDEKEYKTGSCVNDRRLSSNEQRIKTSDSRFDWEDDNGPTRTFREYFTELLKYKNAIGNFDVLPDHATMAHVGKFVVFVRAEYDKYRRGNKTLITFEEIEQLKSVDFDWEDKGLHKLRKRRRDSRPFGATQQKKLKTNGFRSKQSWIAKDHIEL